MGLTRSEAQKLRRERERAERRSSAAVVRETRKRFVRARSGPGHSQPRVGRNSDHGERGQTPEIGAYAGSSGDSVSVGEQRHLSSGKCDGWVHLLNGVQLRCWMHTVKPEPEADDHIGRFWTETSCLCSCHFTVCDQPLPCDDRACAGVSVPKPDPFDWHAWDTDEVCNAERWRSGQSLISRRACRAQEHPSNECRPFFEGAAWSDPKRGPAAFPNRVSA